MQKYITVAALIVAGTAFANAEDITVSNGRTTISDDSTDSNTYTVTNGQLFIDGYNRNLTVGCDVILSGAGYNNGDYETQAALRIHEGATLTGSLTITADTNLWSSGSSTNTISGDVITTDTSATLHLVSAQSPTTLLTFSGNSIVLPTLDLSSGTLVAFNSQDITFTAITGSGTVTFNTGSVINLTTDTLSIQANSLTFGTVAVSSSTTVDDIQDFFSDDIKSVSYDGNTLTVSTIPEPSAFGLLAGVGALALVASRRRRRAK